MSELDENLNKIESLIAIRKELIEREIRSIVRNLPFDVYFYCGMGIHSLEFKISSSVAKTLNLPDIDKDLDYLYWDFSDREDVNKSLPSFLLNYKSEILRLFSLYTDTENYIYLSFDTNLLEYYSFIEPKLERDLESNMFKTYLMEDFSLLKFKTILEDFNIVSLSKKLDDENLSLVIKDRIFRDLVLFDVINKNIDRKDLKIKVTFDKFDLLISSLNKIINTLKISRSEAISFCEKLKNKDLDIFSNLSTKRNSVYLRLEEFELSFEERFKEVFPEIDYPIHPNLDISESSFLMEVNVGHKCLVYNLKELLSFGDIVKVELREK